MPSMLQEALGFQPSRTAMAAIAEAGVQQALARSAWREGRRRCLIELSAARTQAAPLLGGDTVRVAGIFQPFAKPAEVRCVPACQGRAESCARWPAAARAGLAASGSIS